MPENNPVPVEELSYEQAFEELATIVNSLESSQRPLAEAVTLFERGQALAQRCARLLDQAELKIHQLMAAEDTTGEAEG